MEARADLEASLEKYTDLYDFAPVGYFTLSNDGIIREANLTDASLLGVERSRPINQHFSIFLSHESHLTFVEFLSKVFEDTTKKTCEVKLAYKNDSPRYMRIVGTAVKSREGEVWRCWMTAMDITDQKQAKDALKNSEERFRALVETTSDWAWEVDKNGFYTYVSQKVKDLLGYEPEEVIDKRPFDLMPLDEVDKIAELVHLVSYNI
jgi:PAS domain S-box-containing protein